MDGNQTKPAIQNGHYNILWSAGCEEIIKFLIIFYILLAYTVYNFSDDVHLKRSFCVLEIDLELINMSWPRHRV